jgi:hypothetical protein
MSTVPVVIDGVFYPSGKAAGDKPMKGTMVGNAYIAGLGVGGGPIIPDVPPPAGGPPGSPAFPIWGPPGVDFPGTPGYPPVAGHPLPDPPPPGPSSDPNWVKKVAWTPTTGWIVVLVPGDALVPTPSKR